MSKSHWPFLLGLAVLAGSCNDYPIVRLTDSLEVRVVKSLSNTDPVKLDFLWVIDHSTSMCQEQRELAAGFTSFVKNLESLGTIDAQMAVVTVQQAPDPAGTTDTSSVKKVGAFLHSAAKTFPAQCIERVTVPCASDNQCGKSSFEFTYANKTASSLCPAAATATFANASAGNLTWKCTKPSLASNIANSNCSINAFCESRCKSDAECRATFEPKVAVTQQKMICYAPGGDASIAGCMYPPDTSTCPTADKLPAVLKSRPNPTDATVKGNLDLFRCIASPGISSTTEAGFEGGLRSAWMALDPFGPNCPRDAKGEMTADCQFKQLVRDDAYLVIVFISDADDCSVRLDLPMASNASYKTEITGFSTGTCALKGDQVGGNPVLNTALGAPTFNNFVAPVGDFVNRFRTLKSDPSRVMVAAITGDAVPIAGTAAAIAAQLTTDRIEFYKSSVKPFFSSQSPYVCAGARGSADYGSRYLTLVQAFRENGVAFNICSGSDFGPALTQVSDLVLRRVVKVCLPHPPFTNAKGEPLLDVVRKRGKVSKEMAYVANPASNAVDSYYVAHAPDCRAGAVTPPGEGESCKLSRDCQGELVCESGKCTPFDTAVFFTQAPLPGDEVQVTYAANPGL
jgi:hypothetical protein